MYCPHPHHTRTLVKERLQVSLTIDSELDTQDSLCGLSGMLLYLVMGPQDHTLWHLGDPNRMFALGYIKCSIFQKLSFIRGVAGEIGVGGGNKTLCLGTIQCLLSVLHSYYVLGPWGCWQPMCGHYVQMRVLKLREKAHIIEKGQSLTSVCQTSFFQPDFQVLVFTKRHRMEISMRPVTPQE